MIQKTEIRYHIKKYKKWYTEKKKLLKRIQSKAIIDQRP